VRVRPRRSFGAAQARLDGGGYAERLADHLVQAYEDAPDRTLPMIVRSAIQAVAQEIRDDDAPSSTVTVSGVSSRVWKPQSRATATPEGGPAASPMTTRALPSSLSPTLCNTGSASIAEWAFVGVGPLDELTVPRLARRIRASMLTRRGQHGIYLEQGSAVSTHPS
jgi:hypothetical protein